MTMNPVQRTTFVTSYFNRLLMSNNITPMFIKLNEDLTVDFGTLDGKFFQAKENFRVLVTAVIDSIFSYVILKDFVTITQEYFLEHSIPAFYAVINTKPFGNQKYFEKKYYIAECETDKDLQLEVTQIGKKNMKIIGFIVAGEKKQEFSSPEEIIPYYKNLYVQLLCDLL